MTTSTSPALTLYYAPGTCARATHLVLAQSGLAYRVERVDFGRQQQRSPEYLALNPKGRVPTLVTPHGILTETPALLQYVAQCSPQAGLAPLDDPFALARMNSFNSYLCSTVHVAHAHRVRGARWTDDTAAQETMKRKVPQNMTDCFALIERDYLVGPWVLGERYSTCDAYLFTLTQWLEGDGVDARQFSKVWDHHTRMWAMPVVQQVLATETAPIAG